MSISTVCENLTDLKMESTWDIGQFIWSCWPQENKLFVVYFIPGSNYAKHIKMSQLFGRVDIEGNMAQKENWHHVTFDRIQSQAATCWVGHSGNATDRNTVVNGRTTPSFKVCYC